MTDFSLGTWANIADIIGAGSIITGLIVGWIQIRHLRRHYLKYVHQAAGVAAGIARRTTPALLGRVV